MQWTRISVTERGRLRGIGSFIVSPVESTWSAYSRVCGEDSVLAFRSGHWLKSHGYSTNSSLELFWEWTDDGSHNLSRAFLKHICCSSRGFSRLIKRRNIWDACHGIQQDWGWLSSERVGHSHRDRSWTSRVEMPIARRSAS